MAWLSSTPAAVRVSHTISSTRFYVTNVITGLRKYRTQSFWTTVDEYRSMTQTAAETAASGMASDTTDGSNNRTVVTANVQRQNEADAYKVVKTTAFTGGWSAWSEYA